MSQKKIVIRLKPLLHRLKSEEGYLTLDSQKDVPSLVDLADSAGVSAVTLSKIANNKVKNLNLEVLAKIIGEFKRRGFKVDLNDVLEYIES